MDYLLEIHNKNNNKKTVAMQIQLVYNKACKTIMQACNQRKR